MATVRCFVYGALGDEPHIVIEIPFGDGRAVYRTVSSVHQAADWGAEEFYHAMNHLETPKRYYPFGDKEFTEKRLRQVKTKRGDYED